MVVFKVRKETSVSIEFQVDDLDISVLNAARRILLSEIPNVAFAFDPKAPKNDIMVHENTCALHNEFLAHRFSLIPICLTAEEIENYNPEQYKFVLKKKNTGRDIIRVTSKDIEVFREDGTKLDEKKRDQIFPADPITKDYIYITKLKPNLYDPSKGEEVHLEAFASVDIARHHSRWSPVSKIACPNVLDEAAVQEAAKTVDPADKNSFETLDKYRLYKKNKYDEGNSHEFYIDSECRLTPRYLFKKALEILKDKVDNFMVDSMRFEIIQSKLQDFEYTVRVRGETHTLMGVIQSLIYNRYFRGPAGENPLDMIGFHQSHPLDGVMVLKLKFKEALQGRSVQEFLRGECVVISDMLAELIEMWGSSKPSL